MVEPLGCLCSVTLSRENSPWRGLPEKGTARELGKFSLEKVTEKRAWESGENPPWRILPGEGHQKKVPESWERNLPGEFSMDVGVGGEVSLERVTEKNVPESWGRHLPGEFSMEMVTEKGTPNVGVGGEVSQETVAKNSLRELREDSLKRESLSLGYF